MGTMHFYLAAMFKGDNSELQSAMSVQYFGKRVSLGAQVVAFSYLAMATRKPTTINTTTALVHTAFCTKIAPEPAAEGGIERSSTTAAIAARTAISRSSSRRRSKQQCTAKASNLNIFFVVVLSGDCCCTETNHDRLPTRVQTLRAGPRYQ